MRMPFNQDRIVALEIKRIIDRFQIRYAVETGTFHGDTTEFLSDLVERVYSIEIAPEHYYYSLGRFRNKTNITLAGGNSRDLLPQIIDQLPAGALTLFYLDAHWYDYWPLNDELRVISEKCYNNAIVVIDDFKVPYRPFGFDGYGDVHNDLNFIGENLTRLAPEVFYYFNNKTDSSNPKRGTPGKIYIFPGRLKYSLQDLVIQDRGYSYSNLGLI